MTPKYIMQNLHMLKDKLNAFTLKQLSVFTLRKETIVNLYWNNS